MSRAARQQTPDAAAPPPNPEPSSREAEALTRDAVAVGMAWFLAHCYGLDAPAAHAVMTAECERLGRLAQARGVGRDKPIIIG